VLDEVELPQRVGMVQRRRREFAHPLLQRVALALPAPALQLLDRHVALDVEVLVVDPL
jgi:hypothetical protein